MFPRVYFPGEYFPPAYFPQREVGEGAGPFTRNYFAASYFAPVYFPTPAAAPTEDAEIAAVWVVAPCNRIWSAV